MCEYQLQIIDDNNFSLGKNKSLCNLGNKIKYKFHYQNLTLFKFRVTLFKKKLYRILEFKQESFLKPYIERNTEFRRETEKEGNKIKK